MRGFNRASIAGNLTRDPELRYTVNKKAYARFGVAVNSRWKNANGEIQESTEYINIVVWGPMAENYGKYLKKGSPVLVEGSIRTSSYDAKDGSGKRYTTEINADNIVFLGSGQGNTGGGSYSAPGQSVSGSAPYMPSDEDFGRSIGESGFSTSGFADGNNGILGNMNESDIPF